MKYSKTTPPSALFLLGRLPLLGCATVAEAVRTHPGHEYIIRFQRFSSSTTSIGLAGGESLLEVSRRLGHSSITITADTYSHVSPATAAESAKRLANLIDDAI